MTSSSELVARLWRLCAVLRKDGITYPQYVAELTYLLFLKMMAETRAEETRVPAMSIASFASDRGRYGRSISSEMLF